MSIVINLCSQQEATLPTPKQTEHAKVPPPSQPIALKANEVAKRFNEDMFIAQENSEGGGIRMSVWDYGGQTVFYSLHHLFLTQYGVFLVVFKLSEVLPEYLEFWLKSIRLHAPEAPVLLAGTCMDAIGMIQPHSLVLYVLRLGLCGTVLRL